MTVSRRRSDEVLLRERIGMDNLAAVRGQVRAAALAAGLPRDLTESLTMATSECMANAIMHGGRIRTVTVSVVDNVGVIAEVFDNGYAPTFSPPAHAPPADRTGGRGLLLASTLCDRMSVNTGRDGTTLVLEMDFRR